MVDLTKLETARATLKEWDSNGNTTRRRNRVNILYKLLQYEDGSLFRGTRGTGRNGPIPYYKNDKHKISVNADEIEKEVIGALACYQNDAEIQSYVGDAVKQFTKSIDSLDEQIALQKTKLAALEKREKELGDKISGVSSDRVVTFLETQLAKN